MMHITRATEKEVAWFCEVDHYEKEDTYLIRDVFLPHQQTSSSTAEIEPEHLEAFALEFLEQRGDEAYNRMRCWGHSHHTMGVSPSKQDEQMIDQLAIDAGGVFIAIRTNQRGSMEVDVAYPSLYTLADIRYYVGIRNVEQEQHWAALVKERVHPIQVKPVKGATTVYDRRTRTMQPQGGGTGKARSGASAHAHAASNRALPGIAYDDPGDDGFGIADWPSDAQARFLQAGGQGICPPGEHDYDFAMAMGVVTAECQECGWFLWGDEALRAADQDGALADLSDDDDMPIGGATK